MAARSLVFILGALAVVLCPFLITSPYYLHLIVTVAIYSILLLGLDIVFGYTGEVSIGHAALFGIGAYTAGTLIFQQQSAFFHALPSAVQAIVGNLAFALPASMLVAAVFGLVLALPSLRVTGPYLAMVTLAFGTIVQILINEMDFLTNGARGIALRKPLPIDLRDYADQFPFLSMPVTRMREVEFYFIVVVLLALTILVINRIVASHRGRAFEALRDSPIAADCMGVSVYKNKVMAFVISAAFAGLAGSLSAYSEQYIAPNNYSFDLSVQFLLAVALGGRKSRLGPILGGAIIVYMPNLLADINLFRLLTGVIALAAVASGAFLIWRTPRRWTKIAVPVAICVGFFVFALRLQNITDFKLTVYGAMILFVVYYLPDGIMGFVKKGIAQIRPQWAGRRALAEGSADGASPWSGPSFASTGDAVLLRVDKAIMQFGGLKALDGIDLSVTRGSIHGLIGPNGSGKSTLMNILSGIYLPTSGTIRFENNPIAGLAPAKIAALGIARTFQNVQLFGELTLLENILVGRHHAYRSTLLDVALRSRRAVREEADARQRALALLRFVGLEQLQQEEARNLPYGKQRLLEIGRALALDPKLILLDEPAAGLTAADIKELIQIIRKIRDQGITVILIEHHMDVVMGISDVVTVLDFGQKIAEGKPEQVQADPRVIEAYLGGASAKAA